MNVIFLIIYFSLIDYYYVHCFLTNNYTNTFFDFG